MKLKEKFPKTHSDLWVIYNKDKSKDGRFLIESFLKDKGYKCKNGFISDLMHYEQSKGSKAKEKYDPTWYWWCDVMRKQLKTKQDDSN